MIPYLDPPNDIVAYNRASWDSLAFKNSRLTIPAPSEEIQRSTGGRP